MLLGLWAVRRMVSITVMPAAKAFWILSTSPPSPWLLKAGGDGGGEGLESPPQRRRTAAMSMGGAGGIRGSGSGHPACGAEIFYAPVGHADGVAAGVFGGVEPPGRGGFKKIGELGHAGHAGGQADTDRFACSPRRHRR